MRHERITAIVGSTRSLQRLEGGEASSLTYPVIGALCDLYRVPPEEKFELQRLWEIKEVTTWMQPLGRSVFGYDAYRELESQTSEVVRFECVFVPGRLQTERYARRLFSSNPDLDQPEVDSATEYRIKGQTNFWQGGGGRSFKFLLSEAVLRYGCDGEQLERLIEADALPYATVRYLPFESGPPPLLSLPFTILCFPEESDTDIVYLDAQDGGIYFEAAESVEAYRKSFVVGEDQSRSVKEFKA